tara:strand:- start:1040 stop:1345 length:306 start_codon:yes stop_codon:yes gene_type:complete
MIEEITQMQKEDDIIYNSMFWSYMIITKQVTLEKIFEKDEDFGLIFNPDDIKEDLKVGIGYSKKFDPIDVIDILIEYFVEYEDYEKCQDLVNAKKFYIKKK